MIVVTGMHRSGTSFLSRLLVSLGVDFGDPAGFLAADDWNATGYFEARDVLDANSRLVTGYARTTGRLQSGLSQVAYLRMPGVEAITRRATRLQDELRALGRRYAALAVKDPRFCLTLPVWRQYAEVSHVVAAVRHPIAVARSLRTRQHVPLRLGLRFWTYHAEALLRAVPPGDGFFAHFEDLRGPDASHVASRVAGYLGLSVDPAEINAALEGSLRRDLVHHGAPEAASMGGAVESLWERVLERVRASRNAVVE